MKTNWEQIFKNAAVPSLVELSGKYSVKMQTGFFLPLNWLHDNKFFLVKKGCNFIRKMVWGNFIVKEVAGAVFLDYNVKRNTLTRGLGDYVKRLEDGRYLGKFTWALGNHRYFLGYFTLTKV